MIRTIATLFFLGTSAVACLGCGESSDDRNGEQAAAGIGKRTTTVQLAYQGGSNHGPDTATGTATVNGETGQVDITVSGLPKLTGALYQGRDHG